MARLAAYYREDFQFVPDHYGTKQRKAAYVVYDESNRVPNENGYVNGGPRLRALAASEPTLSPVYACSPKTAVMTLKAKPHPFDAKIVENSRMAIQRLERMYESTECLSPYAVSRLDVDPFDCESVYSHGGRHPHEETYVKRKSKDRACKRLSYDSFESYPEVYASGNHAHNATQVQSVDTVRGESLPLDGGFVAHCEECLLPPVSFRSDSSHGRWQQWPWNMVDTRASPALLSPPSPLDSGLSSQSITSNPSLDAEPIQLFSADGGHVCSCPHADLGRPLAISPPGRYDSGRSSPGPYAVALRTKKSFRSRNGKAADHGIVYVDNGFGNDEYSRGQVRYGMLGLIGEPVPHPTTAIATVRVRNGRQSGRPEYVRNDIVVPQAFYCVEEVPLIENRVYRASKPRKSGRPGHVRPSVVITEASDKSSSSPEHVDSVLSPEPESSASTELSNKSSSLSSGNHEPLESEQRRKSRRRTEMEIRELEDMYQKCNLGDRDLLERAERRDLPTAHQTRSDQAAPSLVRSKSDSLYEMRGNPYETPRRAPPLRRSGVPDIIGDDMALRKHSKAAATSAFNPADNTVTYMLCSSHFTPTVSGAAGDVLLSDHPDVEYDDLSYRKHYHGRKSHIPDRQPPFGIPLRPPPPQSVYSDYLHQVPAGGPRPLCHPRGNPDVVRDDMAFRTLRKDDESIYYDATDIYRKKRG